jgi:hypothetical protein
LEEIRTHDVAPYWEMIITQPLSGFEFRLDMREADHAAGQGIATECTGVCLTISSNTPSQSEEGHTRSFGQVVVPFSATFR